MGLGLYFIVAGTLITGAANSLFTKYQDNQCVRNCGDPDVSKHRTFEQPAIQSLQMFVGELSVFIVYYFVHIYRKRRDYQPLPNELTSSNSLLKNVQLSIPAVCDLVATTLLNVGLVYTPVSIYQMTRGSIVLFVALLSVIFLKRRITKLEWISLFLVSFGILVVGLSGSQTTESKPNETPELVIFGIFVILIAGLMQAFQFVVEEHILSKRPIVPLQLVYIEGFFGCTILLVVMIILNYILGSILPKKQFLDNPFNMKESFSQLFSSKEVVLSSVCIMISIATFNFCGITLTHRISATTRSTVDTSRTLVVWLCAIVMGWESFKLLQATGFAILVFGTLCFNGVIEPELWWWIPKFLKDEVIHDIEEPVERF